MKHKNHNTFFLFLLMGILSIGASDGYAQEKKPNIIFIFTDDLGYGDIGVLYQNLRKKKADKSEPWAATPNLDIMANEGVILTQHYAAAPVCAPSRASLLTGLSQGHANVRNNQFDKALADNHTLGNVLQKAGYATAVIGKWGLQGDKRWSKNGSNWPGQPLNRGFDYFYGYMRHRDGHEHYPNEGIYRGKKSVWENKREITSGLDKCFTGDLWTANAKKWITDQTKINQKPFFMFLSYDTPHAVLELPTQAYPKGGGLKGGLQWIGEDGNMINTANGTPDSFTHPDYKNATYDHDNDKTTPEMPWPETYKRYATGVRRIDDSVGDIFQLLKDLNIDDNTLVVFSSDNGPSKESYLPKSYVPNTPDFFDSFGPFDGIKRDVLEGGVRVPMLARWPNCISKKQIVDQPSISYDWLPTFIEAAGLPAPANADGVSLLPALTGKGKQKDGLVYVEYAQNGKTPNYDEFSAKNRGKKRREMQMIRMGKFVGLRYDIKSATTDFEIYNIGNDTHQANDLGLTESMKSMQEQMKNKVLQIRRPNLTAKRPYDSVAVPASIVKKAKKGIQWKGYNGNYPWLPKMDMLNAEKENIARKFRKIDFTQNDYYLLDGYIEIPEDGQYEFFLSATEKALLKIHQATIIDADYGYKSNANLKATIHLKKGLHPIKIYLKNEEKSKSPIKLEWQGVGKSKQGISKTVFFH